MEGNKITMFYDDGTSVSRKDGIVISKDKNFIVMEVEGKSIAIPISRVVRIEGVL